MTLIVSEPFREEIAIIKKYRLVSLVLIGIAIGCGANEVADIAKTIFSGDETEEASDLNQTSAWASGEEETDDGTIMKVTCDRTNIQTNTMSDYWTVTTTTWFSVISIADIEPSNVPRLTLVMCDQTWFGLSQPGVCPDGYSCQSNGDNLPKLACNYGLPTIDNGRVLIICGIKWNNDYENPDSDDFEGGYRYSRVYLRVD